MSVAQQLRAAVVGCGGTGANHPAGYRQAAGAELVSVCDVDAARAEVLAIEYNIAPYVDLSTMLSADDPDVVSVATSEKHHVEPVVIALEHGADVFCEKIMTASVADGRQVVAAV